MDELLEKLSMKDIEKLRFLFSIFNDKVEKKDKINRDITLKSFCSEYENYIKQNRSSSYLRSVKISLNYLINYLGEQIVLCSIQLKDCENFITYLQQNVKKGFVVYYRNIKAAFNKAIEWGYLEKNCFKKIRLPKKQRIAPAFLDSNQLTAISNHINNKTVNDLVWFAFYTGMRLDEIVNLKWKNVDLVSKVLIVGDDEFTTKGRTQRFIPMGSEAERILRGKPKCLDTADRRPEKKKHEICLLNEVGDPSSHNAALRIAYVFSKENGKQFTGNYVSKMFKDACKKAGVDKAIHFHSLRHSFASNLVQKGTPLYTVKELLGHSSISTTEIYSHLNMNVLREAVEKLGQNSEGLEARSENNRRWDTEDWKPEAGKTTAKIFIIEERKSELTITDVK